MIFGFLVFMAWVGCCGTWFSCFDWGWMDFNKVNGLWFRLVGVAHRSVGLDWWWKDFGKAACLWFLLVGLAHGSIGLVGGWTVFDKVGV